MDEITRLKLKLVNQKLKFYEKARKLQAKEYERRLAELNHAHVQAREKERDFISLTVYDRDIRELTGKINTLERSESKRLGQMAAGGFCIILLIGLIEIAVKFIH